MSLALLTECLDEVRRFSLAGSDLAVGDTRLARFQEALAKAGEKVPVFARIATAVEALVKGDPKQSADHLLAAATLLQAVLFTQGQTKVEGEWAPIPESGFSLETKLPSRLLVQIKKSLTEARDGRMSVVREAWERGHHKDLRLVRPALAAIDDHYGEMADFVAEKILPDFGPAIVPLLLEGLDLKGGRGHARRLEVLGRMAVPEFRGLLLEGAENGSVEIKCALIPALRETEEGPALLAALASKGARDVRAAALNELIHVDPTKAGELILAALRSAQADVAVEAARACSDPAFIEALCAELEDVLASVSRAKPDAGAVARAETLISCFAGRKESRAVACLVAAWKKRADLGGGKSTGHPLAEALTATLGGMNAREAVDALVAARDDPAVVVQAFEASVRGRPIEDVFEGFAPLLKGKLAKLMRGALRNACIHGSPLDPRWKAALLEVGDHASVARIVTRGDAALIAALSEWACRTEADFGQRFEVMIALVHVAPDLIAPSILEFARAADKAKKRWHPSGWIVLFQSLNLGASELESLSAELTNQEIVKALADVAAQRRAGAGTEETPTT